MVCNNLVQTILDGIAEFCAESTSTFVLYDVELPDSLKENEDE